MPELGKSTAGSSRGNLFASLQNSIVPITAIVIVFMMFIPLPKILIDLFMVINIGLSFVILIQVLYTRTPVNFLSFPQVTLLVTLFGLGVNVSSTRLILTHQNMNEQSSMVQAFANIATGGSVLVGVIVFIILFIVQKIVVSKGASRVSEVKARFTLDAMNSKMFDINSELQSGDITPEEAQRRKANLRHETSFYSAMDGASKFVSGNVTAGIVITVINLVGGMVTGMVLGGMDFNEAFNTYVKLTIGDGLMSQIPSIVLSFGTGLLVTSGDEENLIGEKIRENFSSDGMVYIIAGSILLVLGLVFHNGSSFILIPVGGGAIALGVFLRRKNKQKKDAAESVKTEEDGSQQKARNPEDAKITPLDPLSLDIGYALVPLVDKEKGAELLERITRIRREEALNLGLLVPPIHIQDSMAIDPDEYSFKIRGNEAGRSRLKMNCFMGLDTGTIPEDRKLKGCEVTKDPSFGLSAIWVPQDRRSEAESAGYTLIDPPTIIATHLTEIIRRNAAEILSRQDVSQLIESIKEKNPVLVDEVLQGPNALRYGDIEKVLKILLSERVSIRDLVKILEVISDYSSISKDPWILASYVREALGAQICMQFADEEKKLNVLMLNSDYELKLHSHVIRENNGRPNLGLDPVDSRKLAEKLPAKLASSHFSNIPVVLTGSGEVRSALHSYFEKTLPSVVFISVPEVTNSGVEVKIVDEINGE